jgi:hypothetical protein
MLLNPLRIDQAHAAAIANHMSVLGNCTQSALFIARITDLSGYDKVQRSIETLSNLKAENNPTSRQSVDDNIFSFVLDEGLGKPLASICPVFKKHGTVFHCKRV